MQFKRDLRQRVMDGTITTSVRIWQKPRVRIGGRYPLNHEGVSGNVVVHNIREIGLDDITARMARDSGFLGVADLLKTAKHGSGERVFYIEFEFQGLRND